MRRKDREEEKEDMGKAGAGRGRDVLCHGLRVWHILSSGAQHKAQRLCVLSGLAENASPSLVPKSALGSVKTNQLQARAAPGAMS